MLQLGTMLLSRVRIALHAGQPALQRRLTDPWDIDPDSSDVGRGSNLAVVFYEIFLNQPAQGSQLTTADAVGRYFVLGIPSRHRRTEETAFMVFRILTAHPTGENPFGWKGVAAGKTTAHANIVRSQTLEASNLEAIVSERIEARTNEGASHLNSGINVGYRSEWRRKEGFASRPSRRNFGSTDLTALSILSVASPRG